MGAASSSTSTRTSSTIRGTSRARRAHLAGRADLVLGDRGPGRLSHFSRASADAEARQLVLRQASGVQVRDAASGFRALSREAARRVNVFAKMTYTLETIFSGLEGTAGRSVPVRAASTERRSACDVRDRTAHPGANVLRMTALYKPLKSSRSRPPSSFWPAPPWGALSLLLLLRPPLKRTPQSLCSAGARVIGVQSFLIALLRISSRSPTLLEELKLREKPSSPTRGLERKPRREKPVPADVDRPDSLGQPPGLRA